MFFAFLSLHTRQVSNLCPGSPGCRRGGDDPHPPTCPAAAEEGEKCLELFRDLSFTASPGLGFRCLFSGAPTL